MANVISYSNFSHSYSGGLVYDKDTNSSENQQYLYISAPSWWAQITINKNWGTWGRTFTLTASYWNGSSWVKAWSDSHSWGQFESGEWTYKYYHNSSLGTTSGDVSKAVLWELYWSHPELYRKRLWAYAGSAGCMSESLYNDIYQYEPIYSAGRLGGDSRHGCVASSARNTVLSRFSQSADTGTTITAANEAKLVGYKYF